MLDIGDILLPFKTYVREKITLEIEAGMITRIHGGFDAEYLRDYMAYFKDPEVYGISHIGWGCSRVHSGRLWGCMTKTMGCVWTPVPSTAIFVLHRAEHRSWGYTQDPMSPRYSTAKMQRLSG